MAKDYYIVLGVSRGADIKKIKEAYRTIVKQYHPDSSQKTETTEHFLRVKEAYDTLGDEEKRKRYDEELAGRDLELQVRKAAEVVRERRARFEGIEHYLTRTDDFFSGFLPGFFDRDKRGIGEKDLYFEAILTPREATEGGLFPVAVPVFEACPRCRSTGRRENLLCPVCRGYGRVRREREFSLSIPPGVRHGAEITLSMEGIGLKDAYLNILVRVEPDRDDDFW